VKTWSGGIEVDGERDCEDCADIRAVIALATVSPDRATGSRASTASLPDSKDASITDGARSSFGEVR